MVYHGSEWNASRERSYLPTAAQPIPAELAHRMIMEGSSVAKTGQTDIALFNINEVQVIVSRLRMMTGYARALEQLVRNTYEGELAVQDVTPDEAITITRDVHGIQPTDLEMF